MELKWEVIVALYFLPPCDTIWGNVQNDPNESSPQVESSVLSCTHTTARCILLRQSASPYLLSTVHLTPSLLRLLTISNSVHSLSTSPTPAPLPLSSPSSLTLLLIVKSTTNELSSTNIHTLAISSNSSLLNRTGSSTNDPARPFVPSYAVFCAFPQHFESKPHTSSQSSFEICLSLIGTNSFPSRSRYPSPIQSVECLPSTSTRGSSLNVHTSHHYHKSLWTTPLHPTTLPFSHNPIPYISSTTTIAPPLPTCTYPPY